MSSRISSMSSRISKAALAGAFVASAAFGQTLPDQVPVKRPDGSIVHPATAGSVESAPEPAAAMRPDGTVVRPNAAGITGTVSDPVPVRRPDGSVVYPQQAPVQRAPSISTTDSRAEERERMRQQAQQAAEERIDQSRREREAASTSPARQIAPTTLPR